MAILRDDGDDDGDNDDGDGELVDGSNKDVGLETTNAGMARTKLILVI